MFKILKGLSTEMSVLDDYTVVKLQVGSNLVENGIPVNVNKNP